MREFCTGPRYIFSDHEHHKAKYFKLLIIRKFSVKLQELCLSKTKVFVNLKEQHTFKNTFLNEEKLNGPEHCEHDRCC